MVAGAGSSDVAQRATRFALWKPLGFQRLPTRGTSRFPDPLPVRVLRSHNNWAVSSPKEFWGYRRPRRRPRWSAARVRADAYSKFFWTAYCQCCRTRSWTFWVQTPQAFLGIPFRLLSKRLGLDTNHDFTSRKLSRIVFQNKSWSIETLE